jgi:exo-beta-1,3-glucanase (GH17 family)
MRPETLMLVQERAGNTLELIGIGNDLLNRTQMAQQLRERIDKWNYMKLKSLYTTKEMVTSDQKDRIREKSLPAIYLTRD